MIRSEYPASESLAREWVECWNLRDIDRLISLYHPDIEFTSPRVADLFVVSAGEIGASDGTLKGQEPLRQYFHHAMRNVKDLHLDLLHVVRGLHGTVAIVYKRETGGVATEFLRVEQGRIVKAEALYASGYPH